MPSNKKPLIYAKNFKEWDKMRQALLCKYSIVQDEDNVEYIDLPLHDSLAQEVLFLAMAYHRMVGNGNEEAEVMDESEENKDLLLTAIDKAYGVFRKSLKNTLDLFKKVNAHPRRETDGQEIETSYRKFAEDRDGDK